MNAELLEAQKALMEVRRKAEVILGESSKNGNGGRRRSRPVQVPRPENDEGKPKPWICPECGCVREPTWVHWEGKWHLDVSDCEKCKAAAFGETVLELARQRTIAKYSLDCGEYAHMTFDNYSPGTSSQAEAKAAAIELVSAWRDGDWRRGMLLVSPNVGVGKTHLAIAAVREGLFLYKPHNFERILTIWDVPTLLGDIRNSFNNGGPAQIMEAATMSGIGTSRLGQWS